MKNSEKKSESYSSSIQILPCCGIFCSIGICLVSLGHSCSSTPAIVTNQPSCCLQARTLQSSSPRSQPPVRKESHHHQNVVPGLPPGLCQFFLVEGDKSSNGKPTKPKCFFQQFLPEPETMIFCTAIPLLATTSTGNHLVSITMDNTHRIFIPQVALGPDTQSLLHDTDVHGI